jgi:uncharacterized BrkB/YihY/UPF0761 family membrane protein
MDVTPFLIGAGVLQFSALVLAACYGMAMENDEKRIGAGAAIVAVLMTLGAYAVFWWGIGR